MMAYDLSSIDKAEVRSLVADLRTVETPHLTKRERARAVRAHLRHAIRRMLDCAPEEMCSDTCAKCYASNHMYCEDKPCD